MPTPHKHTLQHHRKPGRPKGVKHADFHKVYWPYLPLLLIVLGGLIFSTFSAVAAKNIGFTHGRVLSYATSMSVNGLLSATNTARSNNGVAALTVNNKLDAAAQNKANDMATRNYWSHNTPEGNPPWIFVDAQGYSYKKIGENLAAGFSDEQATINGWMNSAGHRANMLDVAFTDVGFGFANNANYTSAGGGPMTIVVAFYGQPTNPTPPPAPTCPAGQTGTPPNCVTPPPAGGQTQGSSGPSTPPAAPVTTTTPPAASKSPAPAAPAAKITTKQDTIQPAGSKVSKPTDTPVTTASVVGTDPPTKKTSTISSLFSSPSAGAFAAGAASVALVASAGLWTSRHVFRVKRALVSGESFVMHHPAVDVALLAVVATAYALTQTTGLVK